MAENNCAIYSQLKMCTLKLRNRHCALHKHVLFISSVWTVNIRFV